MSKKNKASRLSSCQITVEAAAPSADGKKQNVSAQKRKDDAKQTLYINRV
jgi:hypothetical protein